MGGAFIVLQQEQQQPHHSLGASGRHLLISQGKPDCHHSNRQCRSTSIEDIRAANPEKGTPLFDEECLRWPGFVEFDDVNRKILTYSADRRFQFWMTGHACKYVILNYN
eukprot:scaffold142450_cov42-Prasinocladus_malaysianus.AAC.1